MKELKHALSSFFYFSFFYFSSFRDKNNYYYGGDINEQF